MIELRTEEARSNAVHVWRLYWFHESDLDANYPADAESLEKAGYVPLARAVAAEAELAKVKEDAGRMHCLGNLIRTRTQPEQDELTRLMRKYPAAALPVDKASEADLEDVDPEVLAAIFPLPNINESKVKAGEAWVPTVGDFATVKGSSDPAKRISGVLPASKRACFADGCTWLRWADIERADGPGGTLPRG